MKKLLFNLLILAILANGCKSDIEPQVTFIVTKASTGEGLVSVINTTNMYETATIDWGDGNQEPISGKEIFHSYTQNGTYYLQLEAKNGSKSGKNSQPLEITNVSGRYGLYTQLAIGVNTSIGSSGVFCQISGNGINKYFYVKKGIGASINSCSGISDENIWKLPAGDYLVHCENMAKTHIWNFNVRIESGKCKIGELTN